MRKGRELLDKFIENPNQSTLNDLSGVFGASIECHIPRVSNAKHLYHDCDDCPLSSSHFGVSLCTAFINNKATNAFYLNQAEFIMALIKFRAWVEVLEEERLQ